MPMNHGDMEKRRGSMIQVILAIIVICFVGLIALIEYLRRAFINKHDKNEIEDILNNDEYEGSLSRSIAEYNQTIQELKEAFTWRKKM